MLRPPLKRALAVAGVLTGLGLALSAHASESTACVDAHADGQVLRRAGRLLAARERFRVCADPACPGPVTADCRVWLTQTAEELPTVRVGAFDAGGRPLRAVRLRLDGVPQEIPASADLPVDPGDHDFLYESATGRAMEQHVLVAAGDRAKDATARFAAEPPPLRRVRAPIPKSAYVLAGISAITVGTFAALAVAGRTREDELASRCLDHCSAAQVDVVRRDYIGADVTLGVAVVALAGAAWVALARPMELRPVALSSGRSGLSARRALPQAAESGVLSWAF